MHSSHSMSSTLGQALTTYRRALLLADGPSVDHSRERVRHGRGGHGKHGATTATLTYGRDLPLAVEMERNLARFVLVYERKLEEAQRGAEPTSAGGDRKSSAKKLEDRAILDAVGLDPTALAFIYGRTTEGVRKLRDRRGLDPDTGERVRRLTPLTARGVDQLAALNELS